MELEQVCGLAHTTSQSSEPHHDRSTGHCDAPANNSYSGPSAPHHNTQSLMSTQGCPTIPPFSTELNGSPELDALMEIILKEEGSLLEPKESLEPQAAGQGENVPSTHQPAQGTDDSLAGVLATLSSFPEGAGAPSELGASGAHTLGLSRFWRGDLQVPLHGLSGTGQSFLALSGQGSSSLDVDVLRLQESGMRSQATSSDVHRTELLRSREYDSMIQVHRPRFNQRDGGGRSPRPTMLTRTTHTAVAKGSWTPSETMRPIMQRPIPQAPIPQAPNPQAHIPQAPIPQAPIPQAPLFQASTPQAPIPQAPIPQAAIFQPATFQAPISQGAISQAADFKAPSFPALVPLAPSPQAPIFQAPFSLSAISQAAKFKAPSFQAPIPQAPSPQAPIFQAPISLSAISQAANFKAPSFQAAIPQAAISQAAISQAAMSQAAISQTQSSPLRVHVGSGRDTKVRSELLRFPEIGLACHPSASTPSKPHSASHRHPAPTPSDMQSTSPLRSPVIRIPHSPPQAATRGRKVSASAALMSVLEGNDVERIFLGTRVKRKRWESQELQDGGEEEGQGSHTDRVALERNRRSRIRHGLCRLREVIGGNGDNAAVLQQAVEYIQSMQDEMQSLRSKLSTDGSE